MKNVSLLLFLLLISFKNFGQGNDVIFVIDNTNSIIEEEYKEMHNSAMKVMENILSCNSLNRVSVIQYGEL